ncbi:linear gramicidin aldoreductase LgrE [Pelomyxa schiedti]|nr:linear gramicidin aldoreductase LgrE [Pelomyxa schiedti]
MLTSDRKHHHAHLSSLPSLFSSGGGGGAGASYEYVNASSFPRLCVVCHLPPTIPLVHSCGEWLCSACKNEISECPTCTEDVNESQLATNKTMLSKLDSLEVYCLGCRKTFRRAEIGSHTPECPIECINGCNKLVKPSQQRMHDTVCPVIPISCPNCGVLVPRAKLDTEHIPSCPILCRLGCGSKIAPLDQDKHEMNVCPMKVIRCPGSFTDCCSWKGVRSELPAHCASCNLAKLQPFFSRLLDQLSTQSALIQKLMTQVEIHEDEIQKLKSTSTFRRVTEWALVSRSLTISSDRRTIQRVGDKGNFPKAFSSQFAATEKVCLEVVIDTLGDQSCISFGVASSVFPLTGESCFGETMSYTTIGVTFCCKTKSWRVCGKDEPNIPQLVPGTALRLQYDGGNNQVRVQVRPPSATFVSEFFLTMPRNETTVTLVSGSKGESEVKWEGRLSTAKRGKPPNVGSVRTLPHEGTTPEVCVKYSITQPHGPKRARVAQSAPPPEEQHPTPDTTTTTKPTAPPSSTTHDPAACIPTTNTSATSTGSNSGADTQQQGDEKKSTEGAGGKARPRVSGNGTAYPGTLEPRAPWVARLGDAGGAGKSLPQVLLFCFHCAGGNASDYRKWDTWFNSSIRVCALELPGHFSRYDETLITNFDDIVKGVASLLVKIIDRPYAIFGQSMGALLGFEVCRQMKRIEPDIAEPLAMFLSGRKAAHLKDPKNPARRLCTIEDPMQFATALATKYEDNNVRKLINEKPDSVPALMKVVKADFVAYENFQYQDDETTPFDCPIFTFLGKSDHTLSLANMEAWQKHSNQQLIGPTVFEGPHNYMQDETQAQMLVQSMQSALMDLYDQVGFDETLLTW